MKNFLKILSVICICSTALLLATPQVSYAANNKSISIKLQNNRRQMKSTREKIRSLKAQEQQEKSKLVRNQQKLDITASNLAASQNKYTSIQSKLSTMEAQYNQAQQASATLDQGIKNRIREVFKTQRVGMFDLIFKAKDINSMLDTIYFERIIIKNDYKQMLVMRNRALKLAKMKSDIERQKRYLAQSIHAIDAQKRSIQLAINQNRSMINKLKTDRAAYERSERELARQSESLQAMLSAYSNSTVRIASGGFLKPIGGSITSPFGWRTHPIFKSRTFHSGIDIGGPNYGSIRASNAGKVIYTGWYGGYGKVVIIDHGIVNGKPTTTLYAHMSSIKVGNGQSVTKGQVIGLEGSTGYSTGPHCHFEVRINGRPNNPMNFI